MVKKYSFSKKDAIVLVVLFIIVTILYASFAIYRGKKSTGSVVVLYIDGKEYCTFELNEDKEFLIDTEYGDNTLIINDGKAYVKSADCPDKICVNHIAIRKVDDEIVCIPHKLIIRIEDAS